MTDAIRSAFNTQAAGCRAMGAPFTADVLDALSVVLTDDTRTGARVLNWQGDPLGDALKLRLCGGLHALVRSGKDEALSKLYADQAGDVEAVLRVTLSRWDDWLYPWLDSPPQTNEVGRSGALMAGLMVAADRLGMPIEILELGASAGLNLNLDRFYYRLGSLETGPSTSQVRIEPVWKGDAPPDLWPTILSRAAVDQNALDPDDDAVAERLLAYIWPDQPTRLARTEAAIAIARHYPARVEQGDAADWLAARLPQPQTAGIARVVMHSVFWQYMPDETQKRVEASILAAAAEATNDRPLGWLSFEPEPPSISPMLLKLRLWPSGEELRLATCHPHGTFIDWYPQTNP